MEQQKQGSGPCQPQDAGGACASAGPSSTTQNTPFSQGLPKDQTVQSRRRPPGSTRPSALYVSRSHRAATAAKVQGLDQKQAELAVKTHLEKYLPGILAPGEGMVNARPVTLSGCIQVLAFTSWFGPSEMIEASEDDATNICPSAIASKHQLLDRLVSSIKAAMAQPEADQQPRMPAEQLPEASGHELPFRVHLHNEPGGTAEYSSMAGTVGGQPSSLPRSPLSFWLDTPCLTAGEACKVHMLLPAQEKSIVPEALRVVLVLRGEAIVDSCISVQPPSISDHGQHSTSNLLTAAVTDEGTLHVSLDLPGLVLPPIPDSPCSRPSPLQLYVLAAPQTAPAYPQESQQHPATSSHTLLVAAAELLLVPSLGKHHGVSPLAIELCAAADHTISMLASEDGAGLCAPPPTTARDPVPLRVRVQAWEQHLQPLLCDLGLILENLPHIANTMAKQQHQDQQQQQLQQRVLDWLSLVASMCSFCIKSGYSAWALLLLSLVKAATDSPVSGYALGQHVHQNDGILLPQSVSIAS